MASTQPAWPLLGALPRPDGRVEFHVWAPSAASVAVRLRATDHLLGAVGDGVFAGSIVAAPGDEYSYVLDGERVLPDPCSRDQPQGVSGPSRILDTARVTSQAPGWIGLSLDELVIYELHVGAFSAGGGFEDVVERLGALRELGVTAIELMPIATFPGVRNWGYDAVYAYAPHHVYGGPAGLGRLVEAAHRAGLGVILDVVYNHIGPGAEAISAFGPYFTARATTFWGDAIDYRERGAREWAIQNAEMWVREYGVDGLRLDATHAIFDESEPHVLAELAERVRGVNPRVLVISEMETGDLRPIEEWGHDAQWADEFHHELHVLLSGERAAYYADYQGTVDGLARQRGRRPPSRLVFCSQNHDQVGNRLFGDRPAFDELVLRAAALLFAPQTPLLFMGEEYGERRPFMFFTDHQDRVIARATREGRMREAHGERAGRAVPDPQDPATFERSKLDPSHGDAELLAFYGRLLARERVLRAGVAIEADAELGVLRVARGRAALVLNFSDQEVAGVPRRGVRLDV